MGLTKIKQETVINFNEDETTTTEVYTGSVTYRLPKKELDIIQ